MFPAGFEYVKVDSVDEAMATLDEHGFDARVLAGGQSLIPAMRYRLARPAVLVDIGGIAELARLEENDGMLRVGAMVRDRALETSDLVTQRYGLLKETSDVVADPVVRYLGTVVGSICHNDPAGDWAAAALASRAQLVVRGKDGERTVGIDDFLVDSFETDLGEGELAVAVLFPTPDARTAGAYMKIERKVGDFATAAAAVQVRLAEDGSVTEAGVALAAAGPTAIRVEAAEQALVGRSPSADAIREASDAARDTADPVADQRGGVDFKKDMARVLVARGLARALGRLGVEVAA